MNLRLRLPLLFHWLCTPLSEVLGDSPLFLEFVDRGESERFDVLPRQRPVVEQDVLAAADGVLHVCVGRGITSVVRIALTAAVVDPVHAWCWHLEIGGRCRRSSGFEVRKLGVSAAQ